MNATATTLLTIPAELRDLPQWVVWRPATRNGRLTKLPYRAADPKRLASSTDPATWATFAEAVATWEADRAAGVGFVFSADDPFCGLDLDHVRDADTGAVSDRAQAIVEPLETYIEASPSGTGIHALLRAQLPAGKGRRVRHDGVEVELYSTGRFFCMTGDRLGDVDEVRDCQEQVDALLPPAPKPAAAAPVVTLPPLADAALIEMMLRSNNGFASLWRGDTSGHDDDDSRADAALLTHLAWLTGSDAARMDGIFRQSGLYREKWERDDYRESTIAAAIEFNGGSCYTGTAAAGSTIATGSRPKTAAEIPTTKTDASEQERDTRALEQEAAHAEILRAKWLGSLRYAEHLKTWRRWTGEVWEATSDRVVADAACKVLRREYAQQLTTASEADGKRLLPLYKTACQMRSVLGGLFFLSGQAGVHTRPEEWDPDAYALNCADGLLDMRTRELRPHDPAAMCTRVTAWGLGKDGAPSTGAWERHLERWLPSADVRRQVQRDLGRSLVDAVLEHSLSIWYGIGRNGKSTTAEALLKGLGGYGMEGAKDLLVQTRNERHPTEIAELAGARLVFVEETTDGKRLDESQVKRLTGGGNKRAHFMRQDNFDVPQTFSLSLLVNHKPKVSGGDPGIWERLRLVPWTTRLPFSEQRPQEEVVAELEADGAWMLRWLVAGYADWQADHHWIADEVKAATRDYRAEEDALQGFIDRYCTEDPRVTIPMGELYDAWAADFVQVTPNATKAPSKIAFGKMLRDRGIEAKSEAHTRIRLYAGITLRNRHEQVELSDDG